MANSPQKLEACVAHNPPTNAKRKNQVQRAQWLRAAILGANDGLLSTTALMLGVGAAKEDQHSMILSGLAGAFAGACSMAVGEFVSVSTQRDIEKTTVDHSSSKTGLCEEQDHSGDVKLHIVTDASGNANVVESKSSETNIGMSPVLTPSRIVPCSKLTCDGEPSHNVPSPVLSYPKSPMMKVIAGDSMAKGGNEKDEKEALPDPYKAAAASATAFLSGSVIPLLPAILIAHAISRIVAIVIATSIALALFGGVGAYLGGSKVKVSAARVLLGGWVAMAITYGLLKPLDKEKKGSHDEEY